MTETSESGNPYQAYYARGYSEATVYKGVSTKQGYTNKTPNSDVRDESPYLK
jgi:hypothetical protein